MEPRVIPISSRSSKARARVWSLQPDAVLCTAASHGNELAFSELHKRHYRALRAFVFHLLGSRHRHEDAEDVVQDAFARAFDAISERRFSGDFRRWIYTIARNRSIDLLRGERVRLVSLDAEGPDSARMASEATTPVAIAETREEVAWLVAALEQLPERQRSALLLRELAGLSHLEIAETLGTTTGSARQLITRAREGVREAAERDGRGHAARKRRSLERDLLEAAPVVPLAAAGMVAGAGSAAGGGVAVGKLVATVFAAMVLAGTAGQVTREVAEADGSPRDKASPAAAQVGEGFAAGGDSAARAARDEQRARSDSKFADEADSTRRDLERRPGESGAPGGEEPAGGRAAPTDSSPAGALENPVQKVAPRATQPVQEVVELPGEVVEDVVGGLDGSSTLDQTVGNVVEDVTGTLNEVTTGLLGPNSR